MKQLIDCDTQIIHSFLSQRVWVIIGSCIRNSQIGHDVFINFRNQIENTRIGAYSQIASKVTIGGVDEKTYLGEACWIGAGSIIKPGVHIGKHCVIGAQTIVNCDVPDGTIAYGKRALEMRPRSFVRDKAPDFERALLNNIALKERNKYIRRNEDGNYISAHLRGSPSKMGRENILIGKQGGFISFGQSVVVGDFNIFEGAGGISIGENSNLGNHVHIVSNSHDYKLASLPMTLEPVVIGKNVLIQDDVTILGGIIIPDNYVVRSKQFIRKQKDIT